MSCWSTLIEIGVLLSFVFCLLSFGLLIFASCRYLFRIHSSWPLTLMCLRVTCLPPSTTHHPTTPPTHSFCLLLVCYLFVSSTDSALDPFKCNCIISPSLVFYKEQNKAVLNLSQNDTKMTLNDITITSKLYQNDTKMTLKWHQNDTKWHNYYIKIESKWHRNDTKMTQDWH